MARQHDTRGDSKQSDELTAQLRDDRELRRFLKRFLTRRPLREQVESIEKVVATGIPVVGDTTTLGQATIANPPVLESRPTIPVAQDGIEELLRQNALRLAEARQEEIQRSSEPQGPPSDEALLLAPEHFVDREDDLQWLIVRIELGGTTG